MKYDITKHAKTLELQSVLLKLAAETASEDAYQGAIAITPDNDINIVKRNLTETESAYLLISKYTSPSFGGTSNIMSQLSRAALGATLTPGELLKIANVLRVIRTVRAWRDNSSAERETAIDYLFNALVPNKFLEEKITFCIKSEDEIADTASSALADIRRKITSKGAKIRENLDKIVRGQLSKYLQDAIITQRDGRFVVPLKAEHKGEISGIIHDTSSSGSTLFIEPMSVVETNNEIRVLKSKEQDEINRILAELSALCSDFTESIKQSYNALVELDLIFAKAKLAYKMSAIVPKINDKGFVYLKRARHPLINQKAVVPITLSLGGDYDTLIITGPNTGGKTVALKTSGLMCLMAMCGLMIPCDDNSEIAVFNKIFADIGDEQSIEQSLSTFSSHMVNIISIIENCDSNSLVLFDELCAGTDPVEGAALAKAILMTLAQKGVKTVTTTHYPELKAYALDTDRVENASCEFNVATLKPTYNLIIGQPGRSNAFAISKRLGLSEGIITLASSQLSEDDLRFENVVASLEKARQTAEAERREISRLKAQIAESKKRTDQAEHEFKVKQDKLMEQAREKATSIVESTRYKSGQLLNELEEMKKALNAENASQNLDRARREYKGTLQQMEDTANPVVDNLSAGEGLKKAPKAGDIVILKSFNRDATVVKVEEKKRQLYVMSGSMKMWVEFDDCKLKKSNAPSTEAPKKRNVSGVTSRADRNVSGEIDIRGMASDEALLELDKYIDEAVLAGIGTITIIHGKGTGVLRKNVQAHLRHHRNIKNFRVGLFGEGENGVTIAEIAE
ncbi:MAG: endonuclease MutS2 [Clostridia bacterium]|nr:endonuclease MutS2 [Clostridia bacterium]